MARVKRAVAGRKKRNTLKELSKGYYGTSSRTFRGMKEQVQHSLQYQYRDRRNKKRDIRRLWIQRINAAARMNDMSYSTFMHGLKLAGVDLDRKVLSQIAYEDEAAFAALAEVAKKAIADAEEITRLKQIARLRSVPNARAGLFYAARVPHTRALLFMPSSRVGYCARIELLSMS